MQNQLKINLHLFIIAASLAAIIYLTEKKPALLDTISNIDINSVQQIYIRHNQNQTQLAKNNSRWQIVQPVKVDANQFRMQSLLKLLNAPVHGQYSSDQLDLDTIGISSSSTNVRFGDHKIIFGMVNPATELRYVLYNDSIYTIEDVYFPLLSSHFSTLASLDLLPEGSHIQSLELANQQITKDQDGLWHSNIDISADAIVTITDNWHSLQAFGVHAYLQRGNKGSVTITTDKGSIIYQVTGTDPWLILARPDLGLEYHLEKDSYHKLVAPDNSVLDNTVLAN